MSRESYFVKPKLNDKKAKLYRKKALKHTITDNDELDDDNFNYVDLKYPIHGIPQSIFEKVPQKQAANLPHPVVNPVIRNKYTTSVDSRNFFTTFEYKVNNQSIIWDYNTGYVHLTGIWKALGNSKADILHLLDNAPELEPYLKRVRGGFLKIQGSWLNYDNCYKLAAKICWDIRYTLVPIFGLQFLDDVLKPSDFGYGELKLNSYLPGDPNDKTSENKKKRKTKLLIDGKIAKPEKKPRVRKLLAKFNSDNGMTKLSPTISHDEYHEIIRASDSLRKLKYANLNRSLRSASLPIETLMHSDDSDNEEVRHNSFVLPSQGPSTTPNLTTSTPSPPGYYHHQDRSVMTPSPPFMLENLLIAASKLSSASTPSMSLGKYSLSNVRGTTEENSPTVGYFYESVNTFPSRADYRSENTPFTPTSSKMDIKGLIS